MSSKKLESWSYTSWNSLKTCPFRFYQSYVLGNRAPDSSQSPPIIRGNKLHKDAELFLKGEAKALPYDFRELKPLYARLRKANPIVERFWGVNQKFKPTKYKSWVVMKMDAAVEPCKKTEGRLFMQDLKTGRIYPDHKHQASLFSTIGFAKYRDVDAVEIEFWYADQEGFIKPYEFTRKQLIDLQEYWTEEGMTVVNLKPQKLYLPQPSEDACKWCHLRTDKGGPCSAWKSVPALRSFRR